MEIPSNNPSESILFITLGSLHQIEGGVSEFNEKDSIISRLPFDSIFTLLQTRAKALEWILGDTETTWQGINIRNHEYNKQLILLDFGGNENNACYLPAIERFCGRFFLALGNDIRKKIVELNNHLIFLCGLYGLSSVMEPIQRYNCPVELGFRNIEIWTLENTLTDLLLEYIKCNSIVRVFDFSAVEACRRLISWNEIHTALPGNVFHCFSKIGFGDDALIPFAYEIEKLFIDFSKDDSLSIKPGWEDNDIIFNNIATTRLDIPHKPDYFAWSKADEIERRRRGILRLLEEADKYNKKKKENIRSKINRLQKSERITIGKQKCVILF